MQVCLLGFHFFIIHANRSWEIVMPFPLLLRTPQRKIYHPFMIACLSILICVVMKFSVLCLRISSNYLGTAGKFFPTDKRKVKRKFLHQQLQYSAMVRVPQQSFYIPSFVPPPSSGGSRSVSSRAYRNYTAAHRQSPTAAIRALTYVGLLAVITRCAKMQQHYTRTHYKRWRRRWWLLESCRSTRYASFWQEQVFSNTTFFTLFLPSFFLKFYNFFIFISFLVSHFVQ